MASKFLAEYFSLGNQLTSLVTCSRQQSNKESFQVPLREELQDITEAEKSHAADPFEWLHIWSLIVIVINVVPQLDPATLRLGFSAPRNNVIEELD